MEHASEFTMEQLVKAVERLGAHDHLCLIYKTQEEQFAAVIPFMRIGLESGEKCVYIVDDNTASAVTDAMRSGGIDVDSMIKSGALVILNKQEAYLKQGHFDPDWMIQFLKDASEMAKAEGYACLRVTGEMTWVLGGDPGTERLIEYEAKLGYLFPNINALAICQYNMNRFKPETIIDVIRTHPLVIYGNLVCKNFYYVPPDEFLKPGQPSHEVERLLKNILDRERKEMALQNSEAELKKMNEELELRVIERTARMEAVNADLESFSYSVSHDLRAPLRAIDGFANILREDYAPRLDEEGKRLLQVVSDNAHKMARLIDDILAFARAGRFELQLTTLDMTTLVQQVWQELEPQRVGRVIELRLADLPSACGDPGAIHQVLQNLLANAVKFTRGREAALIEVGGWREGEENIYSIRDNGVGFDMAYVGKLFGLFQRLHGMDEFEGTGVGLAIVKRFVAKHGGRVWAEGKTGEGATFWFTLPSSETCNQEKEAANGTNHPG